MEDIKFLLAQLYDPWVEKANARLLVLEILLQWSLTTTSTREDYFVQRELSNFIITTPFLSNETKSKFLNKYTCLEMLFPSSRTEKELDKDGSN